MSSGSPGVPGAVDLGTPADPACALDELAAELHLSGLPCRQRLGDVVVPAEHIGDLLPRRLTPRVQCPGVTPAEVKGKLSA
jgi:hypothetical protein